MSLEQRVVAASAEWIYLPDDAPGVVSHDFVAICYPQFWTLPTQARTTRSEREPADLIDDVANIARGWMRAEVAWWVNDRTRPRGLESALQTAGARLAETVTMLAFDMTDGLPDVGDSTGVIARLVSTPDDVHGHGAVAANVWHTPPPDDEAVARQLLEAQDGSGLRVIAFADGQPIASGGLTVVGDVARLWGGATVPAARGRGAYRAVLHERLRIARHRGATLALVKGRVETSAPILTRLGFSSFGDERAYLLSTGPTHTAES